MGKATQDLMNEHDAILQVLAIVDRMLSVKTKNDDEIINFGNELVYFLKIFADKCHHGKEEKFLFKELIAHGVQNEGGPIGVILQEHQQGREYIASMNESLELKDVETFKDVLIKYRDLLRNHINKENNVLFKLADRLLDDSIQTDLFTHFQNHEEVIIGHGVHEELHSLIHKWDEMY